MKSVVALTPVPEIHLDSRHRPDHPNLAFELSQGLEHWINLVGVKEASRVCNTTIEAILAVQDGNDRRRVSLETLLIWWEAGGGTYRITLTRPIVHK